MNTVIETLVDIVEKDPYPAEFTSSYWQEYGKSNVVERRNGALYLEDYGIGTVRGSWIAGHTLHAVERLSYRSVSSAYRSYPSMWNLAQKLARDLRCSLTFDIWKYTIILSLLNDHWTDHKLSPRTFAVIGDGHGFLGALIRRHLKDIRLYCIDIPKTLVFQAKSHEAADTKARLAVMSHGGDDSADIVFVLPQDVMQIKDTIDCAINIASMQEMNAQTISNYFSFLRQRSSKQSRFYCVNRVEKKLPGGEVARFAEFPWRKDDEIFIDGLCPYYTHFLAKQTLPRGPKVLGVRIPFVNYFDGDTMHRLVRLASE